jgi:hypothetical protein
MPVNHTCVHQPYSMTYGRDAGGGDDDYLLIDVRTRLSCTHIPVLRTFVVSSKNDGWNDIVHFAWTHFVTDASSSYPAASSRNSAMVTLSCYLNILTKIGPSAQQGLYKPCDPVST